jgi:hypothetical protein
MSTKRKRITLDDLFFLNQSFFYDLKKKSLVPSGTIVFTYYEVQLYKAKLETMSPLYFFKKSYV